MSEFSRLLGKTLRVEVVSLLNKIMNTALLSDQEVFDILVNIDLEILANLNSIANDPDSVVDTSKFVEQELYGDE